MSATKALVRLSDNLLYGSPEPSPTNPDVNLYTIVDTTLAEVANYETRNYRWNVKESKFYDAGLKDQLGTTPTKTVSVPFSVTDGYFFRCKGFTFTATALVTTHHDIVVPTEHLINGAEMWLGTGVTGCTVDFKVVDVDGIYAPAGTEIEQFAYGCSIHPTSDNKKLPGYPAKILAGLYIRVSVTNNTGSPIQVYGNLSLHERVV